MSHRVERSALVQYSAQQMFDLVNDIEAYPEYMDDCVGAQVLQRGPGWLEARLDLQKAGLRQSFVTRNELHPPTGMDLTLVQGPFSYLKGRWSFDAIDAGACRVGLALSFEMKSRLLGAAVGKLFESVASKQVDALCRRAETVYGAPKMCGG